MKEKLDAGINLVLDRYSYSGTAYTSAKGIDYDWCMNSEKGLLKPDIIVYLTVDEIEKL